MNATQCPQCESADLVPYGNGSKWVCENPRCRFLLPCCETDSCAS